jgi:flavorubredoxin
MATAVAEGAKTVQGVEVKVKYYETAENLENFDAIVIGTPTYYHDMNIDMKNLLEEVAMKNVNLKGKVGAVFGSYGWSGEAPQLVYEIMRNKFEINIEEQPLRIKYAPDSAGLERCRDLGRRVAKNL